MKIRTNFVTNSSSTSFSIIGTTLPDDGEENFEALKVLKRLKSKGVLDKEKFEKIFKWEIEHDEDFSFDNFLEFGLDDLSEKLGYLHSLIDSEIELEIFEFEYYGFYAGISLDYIFEKLGDKTVNEIKVLLKEEIDNFFGIDSEIRHCEGCNGQ